MFLISCTSITNIFSAAGRRARPAAAYVAKALAQDALCDFVAAHRGDSWASRVSVMARVASIPSNAQGRQRADVGVVRARG